MAFRFVAMGAKVMADPEVAAKQLSEEMRAREWNIGEVAKIHGVHRDTVGGWFDRLEAAGFPVEGRGAARRGPKPRPKPEKKPGKGPGKGPRGRVRRARELPAAEAS